MSDTTIVTPAMLESMIAQARRCYDTQRECRRRKCRRCARAVDHRRRQESAA